MSSPSTSRRGSTAGKWIGIVLLVATGFGIGLLWDRYRAGHDHSAAAVAASAQAASEVQLWTCSMHPQVIQDKPGTCPICHMALEPLKTQASDGSIDAAMAGPAVTIDPVVVQNMGVRVAEVERQPLRTIVRAVGYLAEAEPNRFDVALRVSGWIEKLYADTEGMHLRKGESIFELYSPQLQVAVEELIAARRSADALPTDADDTARRNAQILLQSVRQKLELWGLSDEQVDELAARTSAPRTITFRNPIDGHVIEKNIVQGDAVAEGERLLRIVDHSVLWLDVQVYEQTLPYVSIGQEIVAAVTALPGRTFEGRVTFIHPHIDETTRSAMVRMTIPNPELTLRPGMYATALIDSELASDAIVAPREAILDTGVRQIVFVAREGGRFEPRKVKLGPASSNGQVQVLEGLVPGDRVVTSGQFLLDTESRLKEAIQKHMSERLLVQKPKEPEAPEAPVAPAVPTDAGLDAVSEHYLKIAAILGENKDRHEPVDAAPLVEAAEALVVNASSNTRKTTAIRLLDAAKAFNEAPVKHQRHAFKPLSEAMLALLDQARPTSKVSEQLFVMHCPMAEDSAGASWLQTTPDIANPYYDTMMKSCGEVTRTIDLK